MMKAKIFMTGSRLVKEAEDILNREGCIYEYGTPKDTSEEIAAKLRDFDPVGLIVRQGKITKAVLDSAEKLKVICKHGVGVDNIDVDAATEKGIPVMITINANFQSVAEHALALIFSLLRKVPKQDRDLRQGIFNKVNYDGEELFKKTIGLIGFGRIGRRLAELVKPFEPKIFVYDPFLNNNSVPEYIEKTDDLEQVFKEADIISLHCALTSETKGFINTDSIALMKSSAYIINTSRGPVVNEDDIVKALDEKRIAGAALDTFQKEPPDISNPLFKLDNVIVTSHVGGASKSSLRNMGVGAVKNVLAVLKGDPLPMECVLNPQVFQGK
ncbi:3-phosphoglycerate dehydrogenase [candidate division KSB1 bacterium]|nr:3-phosphoglycerate dehydrogenase [candidate division KSB1 bacterium]